MTRWRKTFKCFFHSFMERWRKVKGERRREKVTTLMMPATWHDYLCQPKRFDVDVDVEVKKCGRNLRDRRLCSGTKCTSHVHFLSIIIKSNHLGNSAIKWKSPLDLDGIGALHQRRQAGSYLSLRPPLVGQSTSPDRGLVAVRPIC